MKKNEILALGLFLVSIFLIGYVFISGMNTQVKVQIDKDKSITTTIPATYSLFNVLLLLLLSVLATASFIYYISDLSKKVILSKKQRLTYSLLDGDEKKLYEFVLEKGECLQKDLIYELGFPKAKVTRILDKLEQKSILVRVSYGKTNKILPKE